MRVCACCKPLGCTTLNGSSPTNGVTYVWSTSNGNFNGATNLINPQVDAPGNYQLQVTNPTNGCVSFASVDISENVDNPVVAVAPPALLTCAVQESVLFPGVSNANDYELVWSLNGVTLATGNDLTPFAVSNPGNYELVVTNQENGCNTAVQVAVLQDIVPPNANAGPQLALDCFTPSAPLDASASNAPAPITYQWTSETGNILSGANTAQPIVDAAGMYQVMVTNTLNGCSSTDITMVEVFIPESLDISVEQPLCHDDPGIVTIDNISGGLPPYTYIFQGGNATFSNETFFVLDDGDFTLVVEDANGCPLSEEIQITPPDAVEVILIEQDIVKLGDTYQIDARVNYPMQELSIIQWTPTNVLDCGDGKGPKLCSTSQF